MIIYLLVFQVNVEQLWQVVHQARWGYLLAAMALMIGGTAVRWVVMATPLISFSLALPISVGGLGVREQTYILLFGALGVSDAAATAMLFANYVLTTLVIGLIGGVLYTLEGTTTLVAKQTDGNE